MSRVLFSGYYGFDNAGDEAVLAGGVQLLRAAAPDVEIAVLSHRPDRTRELHDLPGIQRMAGSEVRAALRGADLLLSGGGSLLQDRTSLRSLFYYLFILWLAQKSGCKTMVFAQGIGPLVRPISRRVTASVLRRTDAITVRDRASAELLGELGVRDPAPQFAADPALVLEPERSERVQALLRSAEGEPVGIAPRPCPGDEHALNVTVRALRGGELQPLAWALYPAEDEPLCRSLIDGVGQGVVASGLNPREWIALAAGCRAVLATRLHGLVFAASAGVPAVGLTYDPKVEAFLAELGMQPLGSPESVEAESLGAALEEAMNSGGPDPEVVAALRERARLSGSVAAGLLK